METRGCHMFSLLVTSLLNLELTDWVRLTRQQVAGILLSPHPQGLYSRCPPLMWEPGIETRALILKEQALYSLSYFHSPSIHTCICQPNFINRVRGVDQMFLCDTLPACLFYRKSKVYFLSKWKTKTELMSRIWEISPTHFSFWNLSLIICDTIMLSHTPLPITFPNLIIRPPPISPTPDEARTSKNKWNFMMWLYNKGK